MKIMAGTNDSPEQMAERLGLTIQYALIDFDIHDPTLQIIGGDPVDLSEIPHEPVKSIILEWGNHHDRRARWTGAGGGGLSASSALAQPGNSKLRRAVPG